MFSCSPGQRRYPNPKGAYPAWSQTGSGLPSTTPKAVPKALFTISAFLPSLTETRFCRTGISQTRGISLLASPIRSLVGASRYRSGLNSSGFFHWPRIEVRRHVRRDRIDIAVRAVDGPQLTKVEMLPGLGDMVRNSSMTKRCSGVNALAGRSSAVPFHRLFEPGLHGGRPEFLSSFSMML